MKRAAWWLKPLYERQLAAILAGSRVFSDETPMPVLDPGRGGTKCGQFWSHAVDDRPWGGPAPPAVAYVYADGRSMADLASQVQGFTGILQVDGYGSYKGLARRHTQIQLAFCLAHARRKFVAVYKATHAPLARDVIAALSEVYAIEARIRGRNAAERRAVRQAETKPILEALKTRLMTALAELPSRSSLVEAIKYMLGHWAGLTVFLDDGRIEVDTNTVERTMRPIALGRKNALFAGSDNLPGVTIRLQNTADHPCQGEWVRIAACHHALYGQVVRVLHREWRDGVQLVAEGPDGKRCRLPLTWTDAAAEACLPTLLLAPGALRALVRLVRSHRSSAPQQACHASPQPDAAVEQLPGRNARSDDLALGRSPAPLAGEPRAPRGDAA